jgi:hypothetical protein
MTSAFTRQRALRVAHEERPIDPLDALHRIRSCAEPRLDELGDGGARQRRKTREFVTDALLSTSGSPPPDAESAHPSPRPAAVCPGAGLHRSSGDGRDRGASAAASPAGPRTSAAASAATAARAPPAQNDQRESTARTDGERPNKRQTDLQATDVAYASADATRSNDPDLLPSLSVRGRPRRSGARVSRTHTVKSGRPRGTHAFA